RPPGQRPHHQHGIDGPAVRGAVGRGHPPHPIPPGAFQRSLPRAKRTAEKIPLRPPLQSSLDYRGLPAFGRLPGGAVCVLSAPTRVAARFAGARRATRAPAPGGLRLHCRHDRPVPPAPVPGAHRPGRVACAAFSCFVVVAKIDLPGLRSFPCLLPACPSCFFCFWRFFAVPRDLRKFPVLGFLKPLQRPRPRRPSRNPPCHSIPWAEKLLAAPCWDSSKPRRM